MPSAQNVIPEMRRLRDAFQSLADTAPAVKARLTHWGEDADRKKSPRVSIDPFPPEHSRLLRRHEGAGSRPRRSIEDERGISTGFHPSAVRMIELVGTNDSLDRLMALAARASRAVPMIVIPALDFVADWIFFTNDRERWWCVLFELAWSGHQPLLDAERNLWVCPSREHKSVLFCPYELSQVRSVRETLPQYRDAVPEAWGERLPDLYVSDISDMADASAKAMDYIIEEKSPCDGIQPPSPAPAPASATTDDDLDDLDDVGSPVEDPHDTRKVIWAGKRIYLGNNTQVSRLFWLLATSVGRAASLAEVQRAVDTMETPKDRPTKEVRAAAQRVRKAISKLRAALHDAELDDHVLIVKGGTQADPEYTMVSRFAG